VLIGLIPVVQVPLRVQILPTTIRNPQETDNSNNEDLKLIRLKKLRQVLRTQPVQINPLLHKNNKLETDLNNPIKSIGLKEQHHQRKTTIIITTIQIMQDPRVKEMTEEIEGKTNNHQEGTNIKGEIKTNALTEITRIRGNNEMNQLGADCLLMSGESFFLFCLSNRLSSLLKPVKQPKTCCIIYLTTT